MCRWLAKLLWRSGLALAAVGAVGMLITLLAVAFGEGVSDQGPVPWRLPPEPDFGLAEWRAQQGWFTDEVEEYRRSFEWQSEGFEIGALAKFAYDPYLPVESDSFWNFNASSLLAAATEPKLRRGLLSAPGYIAVRVLASPSFRDAVIVRAESDGRGGFRLTSVRLPGLEMLDYSFSKRCRVFESRARDLPLARARDLRRLLAESGAMRSTDQWCPEVKHGTVWTFEVLYAGRYNAFHVHEFSRRETVPGLAELIPLCRFLLAESGLHEIPPHLFPVD